jgi:predicted RNase H-like HicB family nuclease
VKVTKEDLDGYWLAECLELPGAMSQGSTPEEAMKNLVDAVAAILEVKLRDRYREVELRALTSGDEDPSGELTATICV